MNFTLAVQTLDSRITPSIDLFLQVKKGTTDMNRLPSLDEYFAAAERGEVSALYSPGRKYVKFKYTAQAIYSSRWNRVTLHARGHVFNVSTGECVLRPWDKFFNFNELVLPDGSFTPIYHASAEEGMFFPQNNKSKTLQGELGHFIATDKLDGSLCIAGLVDGKPMVTSSGAIHSEHSEWSRKWLEGHDILGKFEPGCTYMFETIADIFLHPIRYNYEGCTLLGIIDNATGNEMRFDYVERIAQKWNIATPQRLDVTSLEDAQKFVSKLSANKEGIVITFENGFKVKMKGEEFLKVHKLFHGLTPGFLMENFDIETTTFPESIMSVIPEEFTDLKKFANNFTHDYKDLLARTIGYAHLWNFMKLDQEAAYRKTRDALDGYIKAIDASSKLFRKLAKGATIQSTDFTTAKRLVYEALVKHEAQAKNFAAAVVQ